MGLRSSGPLSRLFMDAWANKMVKLEDMSRTLAAIEPEKFAPMKCHLRTKYVDDVATALDKMHPRARWSTEDGAMILDPAAPEDISAEEIEKNTMR